MSWTSFCAARSIHLDGEITQYHPTCSTVGISVKNDKYMIVAHSLAQCGAHVFQILDSVLLSFVWVDCLEISLETILSTLEPFEKDIQHIVFFDKNTLETNRHNVYCIDKDGDKSGFYK